MITKTPHAFMRHPTFALVLIVAASSMPGCAAPDDELVDEYGDEDAEESIDTSSSAAVAWDCGFWANTPTSDGYSVFSSAGLSCSQQHKGYSLVMEQQHWNGSSWVTKTWWSVRGDGTNYYSWYNWNAFLCLTGYWRTVARVKNWGTQIDYRASPYVWINCK
jgi:hypothetical protein